MVVLIARKKKSRLQNMLGVKCDINPLMGTLKLHSNGLLHSSTVIGTLAIDEWAVTFGTSALSDYLLFSAVI